MSTVDDPMSEMDNDPEYQAFVGRCAEKCHCTYGPCDGVLAGGMCDGILYDEDQEDDPIETDEWGDEYP